MEIRKATKKDYDEVLRMFADFVEQPKRYIKKDNDSFFKFIKEKNVFMDVAEDENKLVAFVSYSIRTVIRYPKPVLEIEELYVDANYRRSGLGKKLIKRVLVLAKQKSVYQVIVTSDIKRKIAHKFYESLGITKQGYYFKKII